MLLGHSPQFVLWTYKCIMTYTNAFFFEGCNGIINTCLDWTNSMENRYFMVLWKCVIYILEIFENHIMADFGLIFFILILERYFIYSQIL
jgi:hypothetical protein